MSAVVPRGSLEYTDCPGHVWLRNTRRAKPKTRLETTWQNSKLQQVVHCSDSHSQSAFQRRLYVKCTQEPTFGACSLGGNVCYGKDAENNHTCVLRNHMHTAENKQNYSFPKYLRVESLQKASNLSCSSKIESRERKEGADPNFEVSQQPSDRKIPRSREHISSWRRI